MIFEISADGWLVELGAPVLVVELKTLEVCCAGIDVLGSAELSPDREGLLVIEVGLLVTFAEGSSCLRIWSAHGFPVTIVMQKQRTSKDKILECIAETIASTNVSWKYKSGGKKLQ